ncbi:MAG: hypothetical protein MUE53_01745 [Chitinophagales bacterium]|jgi:hypothetical protein|nr:hypothetical protein [Chitinophagales bacterium]
MNESQLKDFFSPLKLVQTPVRPEVWTHIENRLEQKRPKSPFWSNENLLILFIGIFALGISSFLFTLIQAPISVQQISKNTLEIHTDDSKSNPLINNPKNLMAFRTFISNKGQGLPSNETEIELNPIFEHEDITEKQGHLSYQEDLSQENVTFEDPIEDPYPIASNSIKNTTKYTQNINFIHQDDSVETYVLIYGESNKEGHKGIENQTNSQEPLVNRDFRTLYYKKKGLYLTPYVGGNIAQIYYPSDNIQNFGSFQVFSGKIGYQLGINLGYDLGLGNSIESGLGLSQYINSINYQGPATKKEGIMYIDAFETKLLYRKSLAFLPKNLGVLSGKIGLNYSSIYYLQMNYTLADLIVNQQKSFNYDLNKQVYNNIELGVLMGLDYLTYLSQKMAFFVEVISGYQTNYQNFPSFNAYQSPRQFHTKFNMGIKFEF